MQQTIISLSQEIEYLSVQNEKLLSDLKKRKPQEAKQVNYYDAYVKTQEELIKLRQAHAVLISMMHEGKIKVRNEKDYRGGMGFMMAKAGHQKANISVKESRGSGGLAEYLSCGTIFRPEESVN